MVHNMYSKVNCKQQGHHQIVYSIKNVFHVYLFSCNSLLCESVQEIVDSASTLTSKNALESSCYRM